MEHDTSRQFLRGHPGGLVVEGHQIVTVAARHHRGNGIAGQADVDTAADEVPGQGSVAGQRHRPVRRHTRGSAASGRRRGWQRRRCQVRVPGTLVTNMESRP